MARRNTQQGGGTSGDKTRRAAAVTAGRPAAAGAAHVYTLEVFLIGGPVTKKFAEKNPVVSRTMQIRGDQTLEDLHHAAFAAFGREDEHMYEFQFGKGPMDPKGIRYVLPTAYEGSGGGPPPAGRVDSTAIDSLGLKIGDRFGYWFDFGDDWRRQINVEAVGEAAPKGKYPKVTKKVGKGPPQYADPDDEDE